MSVIIPVFNRPAQVQRAIKSVLAQTIQDLEIIVVDDGSTDGETSSAVTGIGDRRITVLAHDRNRGGSAARNTGIEASTAPYIAFLDSDDEWLPTKLERQLAVFERSSERVALVYTGAERAFADGTVKRDIPRRQADLIRSLLTNRIYLETSLAMVRRTALDVTGAFDEELPSSQDVDLWVRLCALYDVGLVPESLVKIFKGNDSGRISASVSRITLGRELLWRKHEATLKKHRIVHIFLRQSGWWQQRGHNAPQLAREFYRQSLRVNPIAPVTYGLFFLACLPVCWLDALAHLKHRVEAVLQARRPALANIDESSHHA